MSRRARILCISQFFYPDQQGGVERVVHETMRRLAARGHEIDLVGQRMRPGTPDVEELYGVRIHRYGSADSRSRFGGRTRDALYSSRSVLSRLVSSRQFDVVASHHYFPYYAFTRVVRAKIAPEILTFHASFWQELKLEGAERRIAKPLESLVFGGLARRTEIVCLRRADRVVVLSQFSRDQLSSHYPFADSKVTRIPGGVDLERFRPATDRAAVRAELGLPLDRPILFTARRLVPRMGIERLITAFAEVRRSNPDLVLVVAGRGRMEDELRSLAVADGLGDSVRFVGFVDEAALVRHYQAADLFVLPSVAFEGFGMVTLEALACGTPTIGTPTGATPEILRPLAPQLVLDGVEPSAIRRGIQIMLEWLTDADAAQNLRKRCRDYVEARYGWEPAVDAIENLYADAISGGKGA